MKQIRILLACSLILWLALPVASKAQNGRTTGQNKNFVSTGMPILLISPDAVSSALGDAGVASLPDFYSAHWNNAKFAFVDGNLGFSTTYTPWLRNLNVGDMNLLYLGGFYRINKRSAAAASLTYFSLGEIQSTDITGQPIGVMNPNEFAFDLTYAMKLNDELSIGASGRFIQSDLTNGQILSDGSSYVTTKPARSIAADLGLYWQHPIDREQDIALGAFISKTPVKNSFPPTCAWAAATPPSSTLTTSSPSSSTSTNSSSPPLPSATPRRTNTIKTVPNTTRPASCAAPSSRSTTPPAA